MVIERETIRGASEEGCVDAKCKNKGTLHNSGDPAPGALTEGF